MYKIYILLLKLQKKKIKINEPITRYYHRNPRKEPREWEIYASSCFYDFNAEFLKTWVEAVFLATKSFYELNEPFSTCNILKLS